MIKESMKTQRKPLQCGFAISIVFVKSFVWSLKCHFVVSLIVWRAGCFHSDGVWWLEIWFLSCGRHRRGVCSSSGRNNIGLVWFFFILCNSFIIVSLVHWKYRRFGSVFPHLLTTILLETETNFNQKAFVCLFWAWKERKTMQRPQHILISS